MAVRRFTGLWVIARTAYGETVRRPIYYILLTVCAMLIFCSQFITLFSFYQEQNMIREMGVATLALWAFVILIVQSGTTITTELEDRTAVLVLSKPVARSSFLVGKYLGLLLALLAGMFFLSLVLFATLWIGFGQEPLREAYLVPRSDVLNDVVSGRLGVFEFYWESFIRTQLIIVLEGFFLTFLQIAVLAAVCVALSAFLPVVVTVAATTLVFVLGNISAYMLGGVENLGVGFFSFLARGFAYLFPNLGYFNLQSFFSEATMISLSYLLAASVYAALYVGAVFFVAGSIFRRREIR